MHLGQTALHSLVSCGDWCLAGAMGTLGALGAMGALVVVSEGGFDVVQERA